MRKANMVAVAGMLITFLLHGIFGSVRLLGGNSDTLKAVAYISVAFVTLHIILTCIMTCQTLIAWKKSGTGYFRQNKLFWARRISGFAILIPLVMHIVIFSPSNQDVIRLSVFTTGRLISQILLVLTIALHVITNAKPALITLGIRNLKKFTFDILFVLSVLMLFFAIAFLVYYLRWIAV